MEDAAAGFCARDTQPPRPGLAPCAIAMGGSCLPGGRNQRVAQPAGAHIETALRITLALFSLYAPFPRRRLRGSGLLLPLAQAPEAALGGEPAGSCSPGA